MHRKAIKQGSISAQLLQQAVVIGVLLSVSVLSGAQTMSDYVSIPPLISGASTPNVMLVMSNDHELYKKAYPDYTDLDGDGVLDTEYSDNFTYSGYFDSNFCYDYDASDGRFEPVTDISAQSSHRCDSVSGAWSGNFLNWASMTRMDIVRHVLYGGYRSTDTPTEGVTGGVTVLERAFLPEDVHAFVKVLRTDTAGYTPYDQPSLSLCNMTLSEEGAPMLRIAYGDWPQWSASESVQCHYRSEHDSGLNNEPENTDRPSIGGYQFPVRVQACAAVEVNAGSERCKAYTHSSTGDITYKPAGLLQQYGDSGGMNFGLMTGSYNEKIRGGVLRKDILPLTGNAVTSNNEINLDTGEFLNNGTQDVGIINTLNRLQIANWRYDDDNPDLDIDNGNRYSDCDTYSIPISTFKDPNSADNRKCSDWGNPLSEIYLEALRYFSGDEVAGATAGSGLPTAEFNTDDSDKIDGLQQLSWTDPLDDDNSCSSCAIVVLSTGLNSFDKDNLGSVSDLRGIADTSELDTLVNTVGGLEGIDGGEYLIGNNGVTNDNACTSKLINNLSDAMGLCPEIPSLEGGFDIAGLAYHAWTSDLRNSFEGQQNVNSFSVALAESLPSFELDVNGKPVSFVPTCQSNTQWDRHLNESGWSDCSLVDVVVEQQTDYTGSLLIFWEDSLWGNDYDMDGVARLEYCIGNDTARCHDYNEPVGTGIAYPYSWDDFAWRTSGLTADSVQFRISVPQAAAGNALRFGYIISGIERQLDTTELTTNTPRYPIYNSYNGYEGCDTSDSTKRSYDASLENGQQSFLLREGGCTIRRLSSSSGNRTIYVEPAVYQADSAVTAGALLNNPLWYAAKYGSFNDIDGDGTPCFEGDCTDTREWDNRDTLGNSGADGIPDSFFPVRNPSHLITSLNQVFAVLSERISSGTAAAVVANSSTGLGAVYQAYYHPSFNDENDNSFKWGGVLHSMFIDESGRFREDNGTKGTLDNTDTDFVIDIFYDETVTPNRTRFQRYRQVCIDDPESSSCTGEEATLVAEGSPEDLEDLGSMWNARNVLANIPQADLAANRTVSVDGNFNQPAEDRRYILTFLDNPVEGENSTFGQVDPGEMKEFVASTFDPDGMETGNNWRYLGLPDSTQAMDLVNYVRGQDQPQNGWRSRLVDLPGDGVDTQKHWLLGDIVHSSPLVVNPPSAGYDIVHADESYVAFRDKYARRRQMIYVGANDGMLHAFNGGVWDAAEKTFHRQAYTPGSNPVSYDSGTAHALGAEMWAYVPMSLLPHLQWLKNQDYEHVYFMDAPPQSFDVNIFTPDDVHPGGWGTILVAGMRLGGGDYPLDLDNDGTNETMRSAYVILDITDPEKPPELIAEITDRELGFTTNTPALVKARVASSTGSYAYGDTQMNEWVLVFGSGPGDLSTATGNASDDGNANIFAYDLVDREMVTIADNAQVANGNPHNIPNGYFGDFLSTDWQNDYVDDVIYVGSVEGTASAPAGRLKRIVLGGAADQLGLSNGSAVMSNVINPGKPIVARPSIREDVARGERWVMFGTGRLFTREDNRSVSQQSFYAINEPDNYNGNSGLDPTTLVNTTNILVEKECMRDLDGDGVDEVLEGCLSEGTVPTPVVRDGQTLETFDEMQNFMSDQSGWVRHMGYNGTDPSERVFTESLVLGTTVVFTSYIPDVDLCTVEGFGFLNAVNFRTGTAEPFGPFGSDDNGVVFTSVDLGRGAPSAPTAVVRTGNDPTPDGDNDSGVDLSIVTGSSTGDSDSTGFTAAPGNGGRVSWEILEIPF